MDRVALYLQDAHPIRDGMRYAQAAEAAGFEAVWQAESRLVREATVPMAAFAAVTDTIKVGSGVADCWSRNPARLAATFSTLDDLAPGRVVLGLGAWWDPLAAKVGIDRARPLTVMREVVTAVRALLRDETVTMDGTHVHLDGVELDYVYQERRPKEVPIYVGATGMRMMELTGEIADGVVLNYLVSPDYNRRAMDALAIGAARAGRTVEDLDRPQLVVCSVHEDRQTALDMARLMVTQYLGQQPHIMKASGVPQSLLDRVGEVLTWPATHEQVEAASSLVPDEIVQLLTASGTAVEVRAKVAEYVADGCTCPILYPLGDVEATIEAFAPDAAEPVDGWPRGPQHAAMTVTELHARPAELLVTGAELVATVDDDRREIAGGWVAITDGLVSAIGGPSDAMPPALATLHADGCLVTPGLVNTHHHIYQNLTRAHRPATRATLFDWLSTLYPIWSRLDEEGAYLSAWVGLAELALGGCTTSTDHLYVHPHGSGDLIAAEITAARELGMRFHPTRGSMSRSQKDGGLPPDSVVQEPDVILAESERLVAAHHDPEWGAMVRIALAPCSPFSVTRELMRDTAELAERLDVRLHTHLAEDPDEDDYCLETYGMRPLDHFEECGWGSDRAWVAHCIYPNADEVARLGRWGTGVAHCPSSNMMIGGGGIAPVADLRAAGAPVGLGCDGSASTDSASLWMEARNALLLGRMRGGPASTGARDALEIATRGSAACLGREGELGVLAVGSVGDLVCWSLEGVAFAGALTDPIEAWLRCGPLAARHTVVAGHPVVREGIVVAEDVEDVLGRHAKAAAAMQGIG